MAKISWKISGDMVLSCNCDVFCPCVASLGKARPTYGYCQAWGALKIKQGFVGEETLDGLNLAFMLDIPGRMSEGNRTSAIYVDERANEAVAEYLAAIMKGDFSAGKFARAHSLTGRGGGCPVHGRPAAVSVLHFYKTL